MSAFKNDVSFWAGIMRDHAIFQANALASKEVYYIQTSMYYRNFFQNIAEQLDKGLDVQCIAANLLYGLSCFIEYKKIILKGLLCCELQMNLPPSLINHQINEAIEFRDLLVTPQKSEPDLPVELANRLKIWLADSVGHAAGLASFLDPAEGLIMEEVLVFKEKFDKLLTKASEVEMMICKTNLNDGSLELLSEETIEWMEKFICFLKKIKKLRMQCKAMGFGTLSPLVPDHFIREHLYFISKIKEYMPQ